MSEFTKGPWDLIDDANGWLAIEGVTGEQVCRFEEDEYRSIGTVLPSKSDAHLIAAAPDMYEFIEELSHMDGEGLGDNASTINSIAEDAKLILSKAKGESE